MALFTDTQNFGTGFGAFLQRIRTGIAAARARREIFNRTYRELDSLSNRELSDLGLCRADIGRIAREAAH